MFFSYPERTMALFHLQASGLRWIPVAAALAVVGAVAASRTVGAQTPPGEDTDLRDLAELRTSYVVLVDGEQQGTVDQTLRRREEGIAATPDPAEAAEGPVWEATRTMSAPLQEQRSEVVFAGEGLEPVLLRQTSARGASELEAEVRVTRGRATGEVELPGADGPRGLDVELPEGTILPGMDDYWLSAADVRPGRELRVPMLDLAQRGVTTVSFRVGEEVEEVGVPAGTFEVLRVRVDGGPAPLVLLVRSEPPHVVVRQEFRSRPVTLELTHLHEGPP